MDSLSNPALPISNDMLTGMRNTFSSCSVYLLHVYYNLGYEILVMLYLLDCVNSYYIKNGWNMLVSRLDAEDMFTLLLDHVFRVNKETYSNQIKSKLTSHSKE